MNKIFKNLCLLFVVAGFAINGTSQTENTYTWFAQNHAAWKVQPNSPTGYIIIGNKFFQSPNTKLYVQGFDESGTSLWLKSYESGLSLQSFWKSFTVVNSNPVRFFAVTANSSGDKTYALLVDANGNKIWDRISNFPPGSGYEIGGVTNANGNNNGWIAVGAKNFTNLFVVKFDNNGFIQWTSTLPVPASGGWSIIPATGGGYYVGSTGNKVTKIDNAGNLVWTSNFVLPPSPAPDGTNYSYTEFEEVVELPNNDGILISGSAFSNSYSAVYSAKVSITGSVIWSTIHDPSYTPLPGIPVSWVNNVIIDVTNSAVTSWRQGPVNAGGSMFYQRQYINTGALNNVAINLGNTIRVREAFMIKAHNKYVIGGTSGDLLSAYSMIRDQLPIPGRVRSSQAESNLPFAESNLINERKQINQFNSKPVFEYPVASRVFNSKMRVFPNPSTGIVNVGGKIEPGATLSVTDLMGRVVLEKQIMPGDDLIELNLTGQGKGMYSVQMSSENQIITRKIILK